jgi:ATP synthase protein I
VLVARPDPEKLRRWASLAGIGPLLVGAVLAGYLLGSWIDRRFGAAPWGTLVCVLLGAAGGFIEMVRMLREAGSDAPPRKRKGSE